MSDDAFDSTFPVHHTPDADPLKVVHKEFEKGGAIVHICGPKQGDHVCNDDGPTVFGLNDGTITECRRIANDMNYSWCSATCSKCGSLELDREMWT